MIVPDASVIVEVITRIEFATAFNKMRIEQRERMAVPHLLDLEVVSALRRMAAGGRIQEHRIKDYLEDLSSLPAVRHPHLRLLGRVWELRHNFTAYDASYIALAEMEDATLYTLDAKLRKGHRAKVVYLGSWIM